MRRLFPILAALSLALAAPRSLHACACGCGLFDAQTTAAGAQPAFPVAAGSPTSDGVWSGLAYLEYGNIDQNQSWRGRRAGSNDDNEDKLVRTDLVTAGVRYMVSERWGVMAELPFWSRDFRTTDDDGKAAAFHSGALGDARLRGAYAVADDLTTGVTFGLKLPTGRYEAAGFDRDTQIGTGSTDALLGLYHLGRLTRDARWTWFGNAVLDQPALTAGGYRPGAELDAALGGSFRGWSLAGLLLSPGARAVYSARGRDSGPLAKSQDSGYTRLLLGPALQAQLGRVLVDASVGLPAAQNVYGNQLMASQYWRVSAGLRF